MSTPELKTVESYCIRVEPFMIEGLWDKCLPFLENPEIGELEYSSLDEVKENCLDETYQLWILMQDDVLTGCFLTNIGEASDDINIVNIFYLSGSGVRVWIDTLDEKITEFAKQNNCKFYSCISRPGFSKFVPDLKPVGIFYLKNIAGEE